MPSRDCATPAGKGFWTTQRRRGRISAAPMRPRCCQMTPPSSAAAQGSGAADGTEAPKPRALAPLCAEAEALLDRVQAMLWCLARPSQTGRMARTAA